MKALQHDQTVKEATTVEEKTAKEEVLMEKDAKKEVTKISSTTLTNASSLFHVAIWRITFFLIMMHEWKNKGGVFTPYGNPSEVYRYFWFAYNQMEWVLKIHSSMMVQAENIPWINIGYTLLFFAAFGKEIGMPTALWRLQTFIFTIHYSIRFFSCASNFTNHNYLFVLLMILTIFSGGGYVKNSHRSRHLLSEISACEATKVAMRCQFAVIYLYASLWKLHEDWLSGSICRHIFLGLESKNLARGIPWALIESDYFGNIFQIVAFGGLFLDFSMFLTLTFFKPKPSSTLLFSIYTLLFHVNTFIMMAKLIGKAFPATCIAALAVFLPMTRTFLIGGTEGEPKEEHVDFDHSLLKWIRFYICQLWKCNGSKIGTEKVEKSIFLPTKYMQLFVLVWSAWQFVFPLRPLVLSNNFPHTRLGYRFSWTMMMHSSANMIERRDSEPSALILHYFTPTCFSTDDKLPDRFMPRSIYAGPQSEHPMQDDRTVPIEKMLDLRQSMSLSVMPAHFAGRLANAVGSNIDNALNGDDTCKQVGIQGQPQMGMHYVYFGKLNYVGAFHRVVDPTVDIAKTGRVQAQLPFWRKVWYSLLDRRPPGHEFILKKGIGSLKREAIAAKSLLEKQHNQTVEIISDRAACLQRRPIWLKPALKTYKIIPVLVPDGLQLQLGIAQPPDGKTYGQETIQTGVPFSFDTTALEIGLSGNKVEQTCGDTYMEDILIALVYEEENLPPNR